jgi:pimeloyl-ACP methyl ester carboxylesterase
MAHPRGMHVADHHADAGDPRVILVHGSLARGSTFARTVRRLGDLHVVSYDRRGYGRSRSMRPLGTLVEHVADLLSLVGDGPAVVVGHSYGGDVALAAAIECPGPVIGVGAWEPPMPWVPWWPSRHRQGEEDPARFAQGFFRRMVGDAPWERASPEVRAELEADGPALMAELSALRSGGAPFDVARLSVPAVFGRGGSSRPHHRRAAAELAAMAPSAELFEVPGAAHGAQLTHPAAFADFVRRAVAASWSQRPGS